MQTHVDAVRLDPVECFRRNDTHFVAGADCNAIESLCAFIVFDGVERFRLGERSPCDVAHERSMA